MFSMQSRIMYIADVDLWTLFWEPEDTYLQLQPRSSAGEQSAATSGKQRTTKK